MNIELSETEGLCYLKLVEHAQEGAGDISAIFDIRTELGLDEAQALEVKHEMEAFMQKALVLEEGQRTGLDPALPCLGADLIWALLATRIRDAFAEEALNEG